MVYLSYAVFGVAFIWSLVLGYRKSFWWFLGMLLVWPIAYPVFAKRNWALARKNTFVVLAGAMLFVLSVAIVVVAIGRIG